MASQPLYRLVEEKLTERIGSMRPGTLIPSEPELEREFSVSRATIRRAVENLVSAGRLEKRQGFGTTVRQTPHTQDVGRLYSWTEEARRLGYSTSTSHKRLFRAKPGRAIAEALRTRSGEKVVVLSRVRHFDDVPVALMVNYLREEYVPGLVEQGLSGDSLYEVLAQRYGIQLANGEEFIRARGASAFEAATLEIEEGAAVLDSRRISFLSASVPFEVVDMVTRGDRYQYHAVLRGGTLMRAA